MERRREDMKRINYDVSTIHKVKGVDSEITALVVQPNVELAKQNLILFQQEVDEMGRLVNFIEVVDDKTCGEVVILGMDAKKVAKKINHTVEEFIAPSAEKIKAIKNFGKSFTDRLTEIERIAKQKEGDYRTRIILEQRERQKMAEEATAKLQEELDKQAKKRGIKPVQVIKPVISEAPAIIRTETGTSYVASRWVCEIENPDGVIRKYCEPSQKLLDEAVKAGIRKIGGCKIYEKSDIRYRT